MSKDILGDEIIIPEIIKIGDKVEYTIKGETKRGIVTKAFVNGDYLIDGEDTVHVDNMKKLK